MKDLLGFVEREWRAGLLKPLALWFVWLLIGAVYYGVRDDFGAAKGFYYSGACSSKMCTFNNDKK